MRGEQLVLMHESQHPRTRHAYARKAQPCPRLAMPLADKRGRRKIGADGLQQLRITYLGLGATPVRPQRHHLAALGSSCIDRRAREFQHLGHALEALATPWPLGEASLLIATTSSSPMGGGPAAPGA